MDRLELKGLHEIINPQNAKPGVNYEEIERVLISDGSIPEKKNPVDSFNDEMHSLLKRLDLSFTTPKSARSSAREQPSPRTPHPVSYKEDMETPRRSPRASTPGPYGSAKEIPVNPYFRDDPPEEPQEASLPQEEDHFAETRRPTFFAQDHPSRTPSELEMRTQEEKYHQQIHSVKSELGSVDSRVISLDQIKKEDEKNSMLEQISALRDALEDADPKRLDKVPKVDHNSSYDEVANVLKLLRRMNDRERYTSLAEVFILWGASAVEELFNGERLWFNKYTPDARGWSREVQSKLRRMRYDTSTLVGDMMHDYNIGSGARIMMELGPNLFMYVKKKKDNYNQADMFSYHQDLSDAYNKLNAM